MTDDPKPPASTTPSPDLTAGNVDDEGQTRPAMRTTWAHIWPSLLAAVTLPAVGGPAAVASYRHARDVITQHGDPVMAPWPALTTDGMLLAALVVIWVRRHHHEPVGAGPWAAFWAGMTATIAANLAAAQTTPVGIVVALWPPVCLAITLELIALVASPTTHHPVTNTLPTTSPTGVPDHAQPGPGHNPAGTDPDNRAPEPPETAASNEAGHDIGTAHGHAVGKRPATDLDCLAGGAPRTTAPHTNGQVPLRAPISPTPDTRDGSTPAGSVPAPASKYRPGTEPARQTCHSGHHSPVRIGRVPDDDILAWLRDQTGTTGKVPGRRKVIDKWAIGSPRADRLRRIIHTEATRSATATSAG